MILQIPLEHSVEEIGGSQALSARRRVAASWIRALVVIAILVAAVAVPLAGNVFYTQFAIRVMLYAVLAMSLDLLVGIGGMISMGHAAFLGIGAYTAYLASPQYEPANLWFVSGLTMLASTLISCSVLPILVRLRGIQFVLMTLALSQIVFFIVFSSSMFGGSDGVYIYSKPMLPLGFFSLDFNAGSGFYILVAVFTVAMLLLLLKIKHSPLGLVLAALKDKERRVQAFGYRTDAYRAGLFVLAANIASLAGMLDAYNFGFANPEVLNWHNSGNILLMVIVGGIGTITGPAIGSLVVNGCQLLLSDLTQHWKLAYGILIISAVFLFPKGLVGALYRYRRRQEES
jgi:branched-chain amino acid transport system permease protein